MVRTVAAFPHGIYPSAGNELQSEYFVPRRHAVEAMRTLGKLRDRIAPLLFISEIRTIASDTYWMSPFYRQDSVGLHFTWKPDWENVRQLLPLIERELEPWSTPALGETVYDGTGNDTGSV